MTTALNPAATARDDRQEILASLGRHWNPTAAEFMQSGQIGLSQRWQRIQVSRSGCR